MYVRKQYWDELAKDKRALHLLKTLARSHEDWVFCSISAAIVYGFDVPFELLDTVYIKGEKGERVRAGRYVRTRVAMARLGFASPELQVAIADPMDKAKSFRFDYLWTLPDGMLVAGELDGKQKYRDPEMLRGRTAVNVLTDERRQESRLSIYRIPIMRFSFEESQDPESFADLLQSFGVPKDETQKNRVA